MSNGSKSIFAPLIELKKATRTIEMLGGAKSIDETKLPQPLSLMRKRMTSLWDARNE